MKVMALFLLFLFFLLAGCGVTYSKLNAVENGNIITIEDTYAYSKIIGLFKEQWFYGVVKGEYIASAYDNKGVYYLGDPRAVIILYDHFGEKFLKTGVLPTEKEKIACCHGPWFNNSGGVWIPNDTNVLPKLFLVMSSKGQGLSAQSQDNIAALGAPVLHLTAPIARSLMEGKVIFGPEIDDENLLGMLVPK